MKIKTCSNLSGLSKIHRSKIIFKTIKEQGSEYISCFQSKDLKLHPIVVGHKCLTKRLSNFVDILLKPLLSKIKRYVKYDFDFFKKCNRILTKNSKLELRLKSIEY